MSKNGRVATDASWDTVMMMQKACKDGESFQSAVARVPEQDKQYVHELADIWRGWKSGRFNAHYHGDVLWG